MEWFRWFGGSSNDPKFHVVSRKSGQPMGFVIAVWAMLLERASEAEDRGSIAGFDCEAADVVMGMPDGAACAIVEAMQAKGLIDGERVCKWEERQAITDRPARQISTPRVREFRARQRAEAGKGESLDETGETQRNTNETQKSVSSKLETGETDSETDETGETLKEEIRRDKIKNINIKHSEDISGNQDRARARKPSRTGFGEDSPTSPPTETGDEPSLEFVELREMYSRLVRSEGEMTGFIEFKQARASRNWPGLSRITDDINKRLAAGVFRTGYGPSLRRYLSERFWKTPVPADAPTGRTRDAPAGTLAERNMATARKVLAEMTEMEAGHDRA